VQKKYIIGGTIILVFIIWAGISFQSALTPYVSIQEAKTSNAIVQVKGERLGSGQFNIENNVFTFKIRDEEGEALNVVYSGPKPGNFEQASHVVCVGQYENGVFKAHEILVKCPSKYQEEGMEV
jgi:cytochrome c-type biogenesis protein CcmE